MRISAPDREAVLAVAQNMRPRDLQEFLAVSPLESDALALSLAATYGDRPDTFCASWRGRPVAIGAMVQHRPGVVTLMFFATPEFPRIALALTRFIKNRLFPAYWANGVHRIECASLDGYAEVHRWIELLGLTREATMRGYGRGGETFLQFAWVDDACSTGA